MAQSVRLLRRFQRVQYRDTASRIGDPSYCEGNPLATMLCVAAAFALAVWSIYWDLERRARRPRKAVPSVTTEIPVRETSDRFLHVALGMLALSWLMDYLANRWGSWLEVPAGMALGAGVILLGLHLARSLAAPSAQSGNRPDRG